MFKTAIRMSDGDLFLPGHQSAPSKCSDQRDPGLPGERPGGEGPEETLQPGCEESAAGRVPQGEPCTSPGDLMKSFSLRPYVLKKNTTLNIFIFRWNVLTASAAISGLSL